MTANTSGSLARQISNVALARSVYTIWPVIKLCDVGQRDALFELLGREFAALDRSVERLLAKASEAR